MTELQRLNIRSAFVLAVIATLGSLYFGEVLGLPPCRLCWYQRIAMYPLVIVTGAALWFEDPKFYRIGLPLASVGLLISSYHMLLYYGVIPESIVPCQEGVSCTSKQIEWMGFITIPLMSWVSFMGLYVSGVIGLRLMRETT